MKLYTSYFYQVRFFNKTMIPLSTAIWDPKWFHEGKGNNHRFIDKNGVVNGLRIEQLNPQSCHADGCPCQFQKTNQGYATCKFLQEYRKGLANIDFDKLIKILKSLVDGYKSLMHIDEDISIVFLFHESPDNPCSERIPVQELFKQHGYEIEEWVKYGGSSVG